MSTPLNPDAIQEAAVASRHALWDEYFWGFSSESDAQDYGFEEGAKWARERLTVAQPVVTGEQVNLAGWTCNGIHEPGDYSTCEECRDACNDLARFFNHMMRNPRPFKHWTGNPEVKP